MLPWSITLWLARGQSCKLRCASPKISPINWTLQKSFLHSKLLNRPHVHSKMAARQVECVCVAVCVFAVQRRLGNNFTMLPKCSSLVRFFNFIATDCGNGWKNQFSFSTWMAVIFSPHTCELLLLHATTTLSQGCVKFRKAHFSPINFQHVFLRLFPSGENVTQMSVI